MGLYRSIGFGPGATMSTAAFSRGFRVSVLASVLVASLLLTGPASAAPGDLDPTLGGDGFVTTDVTAIEGQATTHSEDSARDVAIQGDGKIVAVGHTAENQNGAAGAVVRYNLDGSLDETFGGGDGVKVLYEFTVISAVAIQSDGKITVAGVGANGGLVMRLNSDGGMDAAFGSGGSVSYGAATYVQFREIALTTDEKIVVVGESNSTWVIGRLLPDGSFDPSFGAGTGIVLTNIGDSESAYDVAISSAGKIAVTGYANATDRTVFATARYNDDGSLDSTFSDDGIVLTTLWDVPPAWWTYDYAEAIAIDAAGNIVVGGSSQRDENGSVYTFALVRYTPSGALDISFDGDGIVTVNLEESVPVADELKDLLILPTGEIVAAGIAGAYSPAHPDWGLVVLLPDGSLDNTFSSDGKHVIDIQRDSTSGTYSELSMARDGEGRIVLAGNVGAPCCDFALARMSGPVGFTPDTAPPDTTIDSGPGDGSTQGSTSADFTYSASETNSTFQCSLSTGADSYSSCPTGGSSYTGLTGGTYTFKVKATDAAGNTDPTPASRTFTIDTTPSSDAPAAGANESVTSNAVAGEKVTTDPAGDGATADDPVETSVTTPVAGTITIEEGPITETAPSLYQFFGQQVNITAPVASAADPLVFTFRLDSSVVPPGETKDTVQVFRNGARVPDCTATDGSATPDPCMSSRVGYGDGDIGFTIRTSRASAWNFGVRVPDNSAPGPNPVPTPTPTPTVEPTNPPTGEETTAATGVHIRYGKAFGGFKGSVETVEMCLANREIHLKKVVPGPNRLKGRARTNDMGRWRIPKPHAKGRFYAVALKRTVTVDDTTTIVCMRGRSDILRMGR